MMKYAKLILILIKQLVDLNFDKSYMTKSNQKPLYKTRFMLDELGNLQSEGHGISGFATMLSIGLGFLALPIRNEWVLLRELKPWKGLKSLAGYSVTGNRERDMLGNRKERARMAIC